MQFKEIDQKQNPLLKRKEIIVEMDYDGATPSKAVLQQMFAKEFKSEPNKVEISKIISYIGKDSGKIWLKIWEDKEVKIYGEKNAPKEETPALVEEKPKVEEPKEDVEVKPAENNESE